MNLLKKVFLIVLCVTLSLMVSNCSYTNVTKTEPQQSKPSTAQKQKKQEKKKKSRRHKKPPRVEVAFVLDTTGSMSGLIAGAKKKIWFIANQIVLGKPRPEVKFALVPYRDKGDAYVTRVFDLSDNIDQVYTDLLKFRADGGGDGPENVNQGIHDALTKLSWTGDQNTLKIIYLVGDFPPHQYPDVPSYDELALTASKKGIIINTIMCGFNSTTERVWKKIAAAAGGTYFQIAQGGGVQKIETPYDDEMSGLNSYLVDNAVVYGDKETREMQAGLNTFAMNMPSGSDPGMTAGAVVGGVEGGVKGGVKYSMDGVKLGETGGKIAESVVVCGKAPTVDRVSYSAATGTVAKNDLIEQIAKNKLTLETIKKEMLPEKLQKMSPAELKKFIAKKQAQRKKLMKKIKALSDKRNAYIKEKMKKGKKDGFDLKVLEALKKQAEKNDIKYE